MHERGLAESRERAKALVMGGHVYVGGKKADKPGAPVGAEELIEIRGGNRYVSRGGQKLEKALEVFAVSPEGKVCIDCGASTGGFTDCLLQKGAKLVYAVDVGYGQIAWSIRNDPRVVVMERTNIREVTPDMLGAKPELAVIDVSFISLSLVLPVLRELITEDAQAICLIKPQFEAGRGQVGKKGVIRDPAVHASVLEAFIINAASAGFSVAAITHSPIKGPEGNIEFPAWLRRGAGSADIDARAVVAQAHIELSGKGGA
ncbi:MAG: TlyA family RNA methyltransferase [Oscillospiraceae bacterium]|nr:TlyA family RNA methyltransferase [Oscillospiraceae bacterium]